MIQSTNGDITTYFGTEIGGQGYCEGLCQEKPVVELLMRIRIASGATRGAAISNLNAMEYGEWSNVVALGAELSSVSSFGVYSTNATTSYQATNIDAHADSWSVREGQYKLRVTLPVQLASGQKVRVHWREKTIRYTSNKKTVTDAGQTITYTDTGSVSYTNNQTETLEPGSDLVIETEERTVAIGSLQDGDTVYIVGPSNLRFLRATLYAELVRAQAWKVGFMPYISENATGAVPIYKRETATVTSGRTGVPRFSGYQRIKYPSEPPPELGFESVYQEEFTMQYVPAKRRSVKPDEFNPAAHPWLDTRKAELLSDKVVCWPEGLTMTLSEEDTTEAMIERTAPLMAVTNLPNTGQLGGGSTQRSVTLAKRFLSGDEQTYVAQRGRFHCELTLPVERGPANHAGDWLTDAPTVTIPFKIQRRATSLDSGAQAASELTWPATFVPAEHSSRFALLVQDWQSEPVPGENLEVALFDLSDGGDGTFERLDIGPVAEVIES